MTSEQALANTIDADIEIKQVQIGKYLINYAKAGSGPPLLLIHGANIGWGMWYKNIGPLSKHFTVYAVDLPGAGRSTKLDYQFMVAEKDLYEPVEQFIEKLGLGKCNVIGASIGGWVALRLATNFPSKITKMVLVNSVGFANYMGISDRIIGYYPFAKLICRTVLKQKKDNKNIEKFIRGVFFDKEFNFGAQFMEYFYETMMESHNLLFISRLSRISRSLVMKDELRKIVTPTMVVWGIEDKVMPLKKNRENFGLIDNLVVEYLDSSGHFPSMEKSEDFNNKVLSFFSP